MEEARVFQISEAVEVIFHLPLLFGAFRNPFTVRILESVIQCTDGSTDSRVLAASLSILFQEPADFITDVCH